MKIATQVVVPLCLKGHGPRLLSEGVCGPDGRSRVPTDGFMAYLGEQPWIMLIVGTVLKFPVSAPPGAIRQFIKQSDCVTIVLFWAVSSVVRAGDS